MQLKGVDLSKVASSLSLAIANYKPVPEMPSTSSSSDSSTGGRIAQAGSGSTSVGHKNHHNPKEWGYPSVLQGSPQGNNFQSSGSQSGKTVGDGGCPQTSYSPKNLTSVHFPSYDASRAMLMRYRRQVGVNLGSWFVQESYMAPSMFSCAYGDKQTELDILKGYGTSDEGIQSARARFEEHWDTWINMTDFKKMPLVGVNTVRIPIGYWTLGGQWVKGTDFEPYEKVYQNSWKFVQRAIQWADEMDIGVLIDIHGAYGSQNGQAHSGDTEKGTNFYNGSNMDRTKKMLLYLTKELAGVNNIVGIELLNEPNNNGKLWSWYGQTMDAMRKVNKYAEDLPLYFHDAFDPSQGAKFAGQRKDFVVQDTHSYFVFTDNDKNMPASKHTSQIKGPLLSQMNNTASQARGNLVVGEWSCALNERSLQSSDNKQQATAQFCQAQTDTYLESTAGMIYWSWQMENCEKNSGWCFQAAVNELLNKQYNGWGVDGNISPSTSKKVLNTIGSEKLPSEYNGQKLADPISAQVDTCSSSSANSSADSSAGSSSGARNAQVNESGSGRENKHSGHRSSKHAEHSSKHDKHHSSKHAEHSSKHGKHHSSKHAEHSSKHGEHHSSKHAEHSSTHNKHHSSKHSGHHSSEKNGHHSSKHSSKHAEHSSKHNKHHSSKHSSHRSSSHSSHPSHKSHEEHRSKHHSKRDLGLGSPAARAAAHVQRRAMSKNKLTSLGFTDGFYSVQSFAKMLSLSRVGFRKQWVQDTVSYYNKHNIFGSSDADSYEQSFYPGLEDLEKKIKQALKDQVSS